MGKAQSKRSVDITTEVVAEEGTGRVEKIEDVDQIKPQPQSNGDAPQHNDSDNHKGQNNENEENGHEKEDLATEKGKSTESESNEPAQGKTDKSTDENTEAVTVSQKTNQNEELNESKATDSTAEAATPDSSKKTKKDKLKKKWSFRSISFGKKDKQKPVKKAEEKVEAAKEEGVVATTTTVTDTNGEGEKVPEENVTEEKQQQEEETVAKVVPQTAISEETQKEVAPVLNGESELKTQSAKQSVEEQIPEKIEINTVSNGTTEKENTKESASAPQEEVVESKDEVKLNGNGTAEIETPNLEVKSENENLNEHSPIPDLSIQSPPPLPVSPQPSQVISFAINDNNDQEQNVENKRPPSDLNVTPQLEIPSVIETAPTPEIERNEDINPDISKEIPVGIISEQVSVNDDQILTNALKANSEDEKESEIDTKDEIFNSSSSELELIQEHENKPNFIEETHSVENQSENNDENESSVKTEEKEELAECLVNEITQIAVGIVEKQLNEDLPPVPELENTVSILNGCHKDIDESENIESPVTPEEVPSSLDEQLAHKENGTEHEKESSVTEMQNGVSEVSKIIEEIKSEPEAKIASPAENSSPAVVAVAD